MTTQSHLKAAACGLIVPFVLSGCLSGGGGSSSSGATPPGEPQTPSNFVALFDPTSGELPFPTNLPFLGTEDGTLDLPTEGLTGTPLTLASQMNDLDGWSTVAPIEIRFAEDVDADSLVGSIQVWRSTLTSVATAALLREALGIYQSTGAAAAIEHINAAVADGDHAPLSGHVVPVPGFTCAESATANFEVSVSATDASVVLLKPLTPLAAANEQDCLTQSGAFYSQVLQPSELDAPAFSNGYVVAVLNGLSSTEGDPVTADDIYATLRDTPAEQLPDSLAALTAIYQPTFAILDNADIDPADTALAFSFSTQSISHALQHVATHATPRPSAFTALPYPGSDAFTLYAGALLEVPYYLNNKPANIRQAEGNLTAAADAASVTTGQWTNASGQGVHRFDPAPVATHSVNLPVLLTVPQGTAPAAGWPIAIYQHGLTSNRGAVLGLAPLFAAQGWAMVAIDHPLHGILPSDAWGAYMDPVNERHFYIDMDGDGQMDSSGAHATPMTSPATTRDIRRQTVADLLHLLTSLEDMSPGGHRLDTESVGYVGISMGGVIGSMLAGVAGDRVKAFSLNVPGGGMAKMFDGSPVFAGMSRPQLAVAGLEFGSKAYEDLLNRGQVIEDSGDPINYGRHVADGTAAIYISEMVGDIDSNPLTPPDLVLPNDLRNGALYNNIFSTMELSETQVAETAPLSGTTPLWHAMELNPLTRGAASEQPIRRVARFAGGSHYSLHMPARPNMGEISALFPDQHGPEAMTAVQRHTLQLLTSLGTELDVTAAEEDLLVE